jgi:hypothetical protein
LLKIFGCPHAGCSFSGVVNPNDGSGNTLLPPPSSATQAAPSGPRIAFVFTATNKETLRTHAISLLSRLLWYDRVQFKRFIGVLAATKEIPFFMGFLHGYLGFCVEPPNTTSCYSPQPATSSATSESVKMTATFEYHVKSRD